MNLQTLDVNDFFEGKYGYSNNNIGIGGVGVISDKQCINVYNEALFDKRFNSYILGLGFHQNALDEVIDNMYTFSNDVKAYQNEKRIVLGNVIRILYVNSYYRGGSGKNIIIKLPKIMTVSKLEKLKALKECYQTVFDKYSILVGSCYSDFDVNGRELGYNEISVCNIYEDSSINTTVDFAEKLVDDNFKPMMPKEKILSLK